MQWSYTITKLNSIDKIHFNLLLLGDETIQAIERYIYQSEVFVVYESDETSPIAIFALYKVSEEDVEVKNIAVLESHQGKGVGTFMINEIVKMNKNSGFLNIIVGTPDVSYDVIKFYKKNGFSIFDVRKNFFLHNYTEPIIENGILLKDMVLLKRSL